MSVFAELKRRNVFRVAVGYVVLSWLLLQMGDLLFDLMGLPDWANRIVLVILLLGFPVALVFSWIYELTPEGLKKESEVDRTSSITSETGKKLDIAVIVMLVLVGGMLVFQRIAPPERAPADPAPAPVETEPLVAEEVSLSIAVLPFVNMSADSEQEFFSDGITEEILNVLVKIPGLQVTGRTSSFQFKGQNLDLRDIGAQLGVNHLLEGSVRRYEDDLRITAQLVRADNGFHLWSETYERKLDNVFQIQEEIASAIAEALKVPLGLEAGLVGAPTEDLEAYDLYLQGIAAYKRRGTALEGGLKVLNEAVRRDPSFAAAWAGLALVNAVTFYYYPETPQAEIQRQLEAGLEAARRAIELQPDNARAHVAKGAILKERWQWAESDRAFRKALELDPSLSDAHQQYAELLVVLGYYDRAIEHARKAVELDPLVPIFRNILGYILSVAGRYEEAEASLKQSIAMDSSLLMAHRNLVDLYLTQGDHERAMEAAQHLAREVPLAAHYLRIVEAVQRPELMDEVIREIESVAYFTDWLRLKQWDRLYPALLEGDLRVGSSMVIAEENVWTIMGDPRFRQYLQRYGLPDFWREHGWPEFCRPLGEEDFECG